MQCMIADHGCTCRLWFRRNPPHVSKTRGSSCERVGDADGQVAGEQVVDDLADDFGPPAAWPGAALRPGQSRRDSGGRRSGRGRPARCRPGWARPRRVRQMLPRAVLRNWPSRLSCGRELFLGSRGSWSSFRAMRLLDAGRELGQMPLQCRPAPCRGRRGSAWGRPSAAWPIRPAGRRAGCAASADRGAGLRRRASRPARGRSPASAARGPRCPPIRGQRSPASKASRSRCQSASSAASQLQPAQLAQLAVQHAADRLQVGHVEQGIFELPLRERPPAPVGSRFVLGDRLAQQLGRQRAVRRRILQADQARGNLHVEPLPPAAAAVPQEEAELLAAGVNQRLAAGRAEQIPERRQVVGLVGIDDRQPAPGRQLDQAQLRLIASLPKRTPCRRPQSAQRRSSRKSPADAGRR